MHAPELGPMLATAGTAVPGPDGWAFEIKWDGIRAVLTIDDRGLEVRNRSGRDVTNRFPELAGLPDALAGRRAVLDAELVAMDDAGRPSFQALQARMHVDRPAPSLVREAPVTAMLFDVLWLDGEPLIDRPWRERRAALDELDLNGAAWRTPPVSVDDPDPVAAIVDARGLEGMIAKRVDAPYEPGRRTSAWRKLKAQRRQELVVGGWQPGKGARASTFGSLLLGYHDADGRLQFAGKVGTGFDERELARLRAELVRRRRDDSPFASRTGIPRDAVFCEPELVVEVRFTEWTSDGRLRHPAYLGQRDDRDPRSVVREPVP